MNAYLGFRKRLQDKVNKNYKLSCKLLRLQATSKEIANKFLKHKRDNGALGWAPPKMKLHSPDPKTSNIPTNHESRLLETQPIPTVKNSVLCFTHQKPKSMKESNIDQKDVEMQLTAALEKHILLKKRISNSENLDKIDFRNSCPTEILPESIALIINNELGGRFSVGQSIQFDKVSTKRKKKNSNKKMNQTDTLSNEKHYFMEMRSDQIVSFGKKQGAEKQRELVKWAKDKIRSFREKDKVEDLPISLPKESTPEPDPQDTKDMGRVFKQLQTEKSEVKRDPGKLQTPSNLKTSIYDNWTKKKHENKTSHKRINLEPFSGKFEAIPNFENKLATRGKKQGPNLYNKKQRREINSSMKNIPQIKKDENFWRRMGMGKVNSRMTRSFFISKHARKVTNGKKHYKKSTFPKKSDPKTRSAIKRDLFEKGSSSYANLFSEFNPSYKKTKKCSESSQYNRASPCLSLKMIKTFDLEWRNRYTIPGKQEPKKCLANLSPKEDSHIYLRKLPRR